MRKSDKPTGSTMHLETATEADAPALAALYFTCFTNAAHRRVFPPTPEIHAWWTANLRRKIASGRSVVLKMVDWEAEALPAGIGSAGEGSESGSESDSSAAGRGSESGSYAGSDDATEPSSAVGDADAHPGVEKESMKGKGRTVAFAEWELPPSSPAPAPSTPVQSQDQDPAQPTLATQPQDAEDPNLDHTLPPNLSPSDKDLLLRLRAQTTRHREEDMRGVEGGYYYLSILGTNPAYQSQGLGSRLLAWGIERARAEGRQIYLCASREGRPLYVKRGFVRVSEGEVVVEEGGERNWFMVWRG